MTLFENSSNITKELKSQLFENYWTNFIWNTCTFFQKKIAFHDYDWVCPLLDNLFIVDNVCSIVWRTEMSMKYSDGANTFLVCHGRSQDFSKEGSHWVIQRVLTRLSPEYCRLFAYKKAYKGGGLHAPQEPPLATPPHDTNVEQRKILNPRQESNPWPPEHQAGALSTELVWEFMKSKVI